jgi:hypothetical protein
MSNRFARFADQDARRRADQNTTVVTTTNKAKRDAMFADLRANGNEFERQVVKFSGSQPVLGEAGTQEGRFIFYDKKRLHPQWRPLFESTWSVSYPTA